MIYIMNYNDGSGCGWNFRPIQYDGTKEELEIFFKESALACPNKCHFEFLNLIGFNDLAKHNFVSHTGYYDAPMFYTLDEWLFEFGIKND